jgi:hypothetical protein
VGLQDAIKLVQPSIKREGFTSIPEVTWEDVGSLGHVCEELEFSVCEPMKFPEDYKVCNLIGVFPFKNTILAHELLSLRQNIICNNHKLSMTTKIFDDLLMRGCQRLVLIH